MVVPLIQVVMIAIEGTATHLAPTATPKEKQMFFQMTGPDAEHKSLHDR